MEHLEQFQDVELVSDGEIIPCHKLILALNSQYFRTLFMSSFQEEDSIEIMSFGPQTMKTIKKFIYTGELEVERENREEISEALEAFNFFVISDESGKLEDRIFPFLDSLDEYEKELLANYRHITQILLRRAVARIQSSLDNSTGDLSDLSDDELNIAADLVSTGHLSTIGMNTLATRIQGSWSRDYFYPSVAEVRLAATLAVTGHLTEVENMKLRDLQLPSTDGMLSLARVVSDWVELMGVTGDVAPLLSILNCRQLWMTNMELEPNQAATLSCSRVSYEVWLRGVTGDVAPLLSSLTCSELLMFNMELDQAATCSGVSHRVDLMNVTGDVGPLLSSLTCKDLWISDMKLNQTATRSLVQGLEHGVKRLVLDGGEGGPVTLHIHTLVEYDGRGRCGEVMCYGNTAAAYREDMKTWAERINWDVTEGRRIVMRRRDD